MGRDLADEAEAVDPPAGAGGPEPAHHPHRDPAHDLRGRLDRRRCDGVPAPLQRRAARSAFTGPRSKLNGRVTGARCVATHQIDLARLRAISIAADASLNDVFLAVCSTAIRRHLLDSDDLPGRSLIAGVPVKVDDEYGQRRNSAGYAMAFLGTDIEDPLERLAAIKTSMLAVKRQLAPMTPQARLRFLTAMSAPGMGVLLTGMGSLLPPPMNVTISNVPGPKEPLYMNGGHVDALYPVSIPFQGQARTSPASPMSTTWTSGSPVAATACPTCNVWRDIPPTPLPNSSRPSTSA